MLIVQPITQKEANRFIKVHHRHHRPPQGYKFAIAVSDGEKIVGVITVGRPVSYRMDDGFTAEVTRCCTDGTKNACSKLYAAAWRASRSMGYTRIITYVLKSESGGSLKASGWKCLYESRGGSWKSNKRFRIDTHPLGAKTLWEKAA